MVIDSVAWQSGFHFGYGVNAITGELAAQGVENFSVDRPTVKRSKEKIVVLRNEAQLTEAASFSAGSAFNIAPLGVNVGGMGSVMSKVELSATSFSVLATYTSWYETNDLATTYTLQKEAADLARTDQAKFREQYGDYFIAGGRRGSTFIALVIYSSSDATSLKKFETQLTVSNNDMFKADVAAKLDAAASEAQVKVTIETEMQGIGISSTPVGSPGTMRQIVDVLSWFRENEVGTYIYARLHHYSTLQSARNIPKSLSINAQVFEELSHLYSLLFTTRILSGSCPPTETREEVQAQVDALYAQAEGRQNVLATSTIARKHLLDSIQELHRLLRRIHRRYRFWIDIQSIIPMQPQNRRHVAEKNVQHWSWGYKTYPIDTTIDIRATSQPLLLPRSLWPSRRDAIVTANAPDGHIIVGWEVISHRADGHNGSWRKLSQDFLSSSSGRITFRTKRFRASHWEIIIYHVGDPVFTSFGSGLLDLHDLPTENILSAAQHLRFTN
jgi:hypothetical protein